MILKQDVLDALEDMEISLFNGVSNKEEVSVPMRILSVFSEAYQRDFRPEQSIILLESARLLREKGCYYTHDE